MKFWKTREERHRNLEVPIKHNLELEVHAEHIYYSRATFLRGCKIICSIFNSNFKIYLSVIDEYNRKKYNFFNKT